MPWMEQARLLLRRAHDDDTALRKLASDPEIIDATLRHRVDMLSGRVSQLEHGITEIRASNDDLISNVETLRGDVDCFIAGSSNWRDVVSDVEVDTQDVESAASDVDTAVSNLE